MIYFYFLQMLETDQKIECDFVYFVVFVSA